MLILLFISRLWAIDLDYYKFTNNPVYAISEDALAEHSLVNNFYPYLFSASLSHVKTPLSIKEDNQRTGDLVRHMTSLHFGGTYSVIETLQIGFRSYATKMSLPEPGEDGFFMGDSKLEAKWKFLQTAHSAWALHPRLTLPSGSQEFSGQKKVGGYLGLNLEKRFRWFQAVLNLGYSHEPGAKYSLGPDYTDINYAQAIYTGIGSIFSIKEKWYLNLEAYRFNQVKGNQHPNEIYAGVRHETTAQLTSFAGLAMGGSIDQTSNDYRVSLGVKWTPYSYKRPEVEPVISKPVLRDGETYERIVIMKQEQDMYGSLVDSGQIYFGNNSIQLDDEAKKVLKIFAEKILKSKNGKIIVEGFAETFSKKGDENSGLLARVGSESIDVFGRCIR
jgi:outer membrane protein OmpA-like peptidoglycan-associated protein